MIRLDRWLTALALGSRTQTQKLIRSGRVAVNGAPARDPALHCDPEQSSLALDGHAIDGRLMRHVLLHKPAGLLTAARDPKQPTVMSLLPPVYASLGCMPVGRLDKDTTGVLLLTCDGTLAHRLLSPERHVEKVYRARVDAPLEPWMTEAFAAGLSLGDFTAQSARLEIGPDPLEGRVTLREGKFHQVKRMFAAVGREVQALYRERFGPLTLGDLPCGGWRELEPAEVLALREAVDMSTDGGEEKPDE